MYMIMELYLHNRSPYIDREEDKSSLLHRMDLGDGRRCLLRTYTAK